MKTEKTKEAKKGVLKRIAGPVVTAVNLDAHMYDVVKVGKEALMGEVIKIQGDNTIIQVYEDTSGIRPGEPVINTGLSLSVELVPGFSPVSTMVSSARLPSSWKRWATSSSVV